MIYRTLHSYILRELLRVFLLTASALTTMMAFGGTFRPLTKQGIDVRELLVIVVNMMPAMMAYAIPIAALFAAVLVYWRMSTDNELTACRAGGVSFIAIVAPAFMLGITVASIDMMFVNYVVPKFLQSTERAVRQDMGSLIVSQVGRQEKFQFDLLPLVVTADSAELKTTADPDITQVELKGMAAALVDKQGRPTYMAVAQKAEIEIHNLPAQDMAEVTFRVQNSSAFEPTNGYKKVSMSVDWAKLTGKPIPVPSLLRTKAKFLNLTDLRKLSLNPFPFPSVAEVFDRIKSAQDFEHISQNVQAQWQRDGHRISFDEMSNGGRSATRFTVTAPRAELDPASAPEECLTFSSTNSQRVKIVQSDQGRTLATYFCDQADLVLSAAPVLGPSIGVKLRVEGHVRSENNVLNTPAMDQATMVFGGLGLEQAMLDVSQGPELQNSAGDTEKKMAMVADARHSQRQSVRELGDLVAARMTKLNQTIDSELHSRGSFSLSCLTLVMLGAALGILLRGQNPLAVFVVGFVPAVVLVLLITAGRQLTEGNARNVTTGISLIWAGNAVLLLLVAGVYLKLLRR